MSLPPFSKFIVLIMKWKNYYSLLLFFFMCSSALAQENIDPTPITNNNLSTVESLAVSGDETPWSIISDSEGIKTYRKEILGSKVFPLKGVTILNAPIVKVLTLMLDDDRATEWIDLLAEIKLIKTYSDSRYILLYEMDSPLSLFVKKRDFLLESNFTYHKKEETVTLSLQSVEDDSVPEQKGYVRGDIYKSEWNFTALEKEGKTLVSLEYHVDPRGLTPKWLVRAFQKNWPHKTLKKLDRYLQEEAIDTNPILYDLAPDLMR